MPTLTPINALYMLKQLIVGSNTNGAADGGYLQDIDYSAALFSSATSSTISTTSAGAIGPFKVPRDYDSNSDTLQFRFLGSTGTTTAAPGQPISTFLSLVMTPGGGAAGSTLATHVSSTAFVNGTLTAFSVDVSGSGLAQDDTFYLNLSTTHNITLFGAAMVYRSCLVAFSMYGNELVGTSTQEIR